MISSKLSLPSSKYTGFFTLVSSMDKSKQYCRRYILWVCVSLLCHCCYACALLVPEEFLALQAIRKGLQDMPGSTFFSSWDFTGDPCSFMGVYCNSNKIIALNLGDPRAGSPGLIGHIDPAIGKLSSLTVLTIVPGRVMGALPQTVTRCRNLRFIAISRNYISGSIPFSISNLRNLQTLDLSYNILTGTIPISIGELHFLSNLILGHNRLSGSIPILISTSLVRLDLKHNDLSGIIRASALPSSVRYLSLSSNRLTGSIDRFLHRLNKLNYLDLCMNNFMGNVPSFLFSLPLSSLQLQRNRLSGPVRPLNQVTVSIVDLSFNGLSGSISPLLSTVGILYLNNNRFTGKVPASFVQRLLEAGIQVLYLQHNYLTGMEINPTAEIPRSSSLCLQYNCMVPPVKTPCPLKVGHEKARPISQCKGL